MKKKFLFLLLSMFLCFVPASMDGRVRIKYTGPVQERTEEEHQQDIFQGLLFGGCFIALVVYLKMRKRK